MISKFYEKEMSIKILETLSDYNESYWLNRLYEHLGYDKQQMSQIIKMLSRKGYIDKPKVNRNGYKIPLTITLKGSLYLKEIKRND